MEKGVSLPPVDNSDVPLQEKKLKPSPSDADDSESAPAGQEPGGENSTSEKRLDEGTANVARPTILSSAKYKSYLDRIQRALWSVVQASGVTTLPATGDEVIDGAT
eukprot:GHVU01133905.1.p4 GENE.GHVU01133905.1~~GHVU01133905.1.p4  ORF type:complete len:106 (+),score=14.04 GHVU01133905.1:163-480(+)